MLQLLARGYTQKEVAKALGINHDTVRNHVTHILRKLEARNTVHAVYLVWGGEQGEMAAAEIQ